MSRRSRRQRGKGATSGKNVIRIDQEKSTAVAKRKSRLSAYNGFSVNSFLYGSGVGGAYEGAGSDRVTRNWRYSNASADAEILGDLDTLRARSRDLYRNNAIGRGAIGTMAVNVIGSGLKLQSVVNREYLGMVDEHADNWENNTERKFNIWAESLDCDAGRKSDFYDLELLAFLSYMQSGEVFVLLPILNRGNGYQLAVQLIEADLVSNPPGRYDDKNMRAGIEVDEYGAPKAYHVLVDTATWKKVPAYGEQTHRPNVLHLFRQERPGQTRGIPFLASVIENIKELGRYNKSELAAAVVSSMFTVFVKSNNPNALDNPLSGVGGTSSSIEDTDDIERDYTLAPGAVYRLDDNEDINLANPTRPNTAYEAFISAQLREIGMALQIPYEILAKQFLASYSASRASRIEAWRYFTIERDRFARRFCQPIYEEWMTEEIVHSRIPAMGFLDSIDVRKAYTGAKWLGQSMGQIDETKEVGAALLRIEGGLSTYQDEAAAINGSDFKQNAKQLRREAALLGEYRKTMAESILQGAYPNDGPEQ